jgi:SAM-dependent methyltransferase
VNRLAGAQELLDGELDRDLLRGNLDDLARVNRWLGGVALSRRAIVALLASDRDGGRIDLLDVGTGAGDIPTALVRWFRDRDVSVRATATETRPEIVEEARGRTASVPDLSIELVTEGRLPYPDGAFDVGHCSLVMHHLDEPAATELLRELARVSRLGVVVNDLDRRRRFRLGATLMAAITTRNAYTRHDGPLSVRRAYRPDELTGLAGRAGLGEVARFVHPLGYRYAIAFTKAPDPQPVACGLD